MTPQRNDWPMDELERVLREQAEANRQPPKTWVCGWGGKPRCDVRLPERGLCEEHRAIIRASLRDVKPQPPAGKAIPGARKPDPQRHYSTEAEREAAARRVADYIRGHPRTNGDQLAKALDIKRGSRLFRHALDIALERGWISSSGPHGYLPGNMNAAEARAREIAQVVAEASGPVTRPDLVARFGSSTPVAIRLAKENGWIVSHGREGYTPGPNAQSALAAA